MSDLEKINSIFNARVDSVKTKEDLQRHLADIHDTNIKWFCCDMCEFKCKRGSNLKTHLANIHDINVEWFCCDTCPYRSKTRSNLKTILQASTISTLNGFVATSARTEAKLIALSQTTVNAYTVFEYKCTVKGNIG